MKSINSTPNINFNTALGFGRMKLLFDKTFCFSTTASIPAQLGSLSPDMTTVKTCLNDPTASGCTGTYSGSSSIPGIVSTVPALGTDVTTLKGCMSDPTDPSCTGTYSDATNLNKLVDSISKCMTSPTADDCTSIYSNPTTLPKVAHIYPKFDLIHRFNSLGSGRKVWWINMHHPQHRCHNAQGMYDRPNRLIMHRHLQHNILHAWEDKIYWCSGRSQPSTNHRAHVMCQWKRCLSVSPRWAMSLLNRLNQIF